MFVINCLASAGVLLAPVTSMPQVPNVRASEGDNPAEIDAQWDARIRGKKGFLARIREHKDGPARGPHLQYMQ